MKTVLVVLALFFKLFLFSQNKTVLIVDIKETKYYYVYYATEKQDQIEKSVILLSSKPSEGRGYPEVILKKNTFYDVATRFYSQIKISEAKFMNCSPGIINVDNVQISTKGNLPILITDYKKIKCTVD